MFAAASDRVDVVKLLLSRGADLNATSRVEDFSALTMTQRRRSERRAAPQAPPPPGGKDIPGVTRPFNYNELIGKHGGLSALHFAARQGAMATAEALIKAGANVNQRGAGDQTTPIIVAAINGHFDLVSYLLDNGADPNLVERRRRDAALRRDQRAVAAALVLSAAARLPAAEDRLPRADEEAARQGRRSERAHQSQDRGSREYNFDLLRTDDSGATRVLARRVCQRHRRDEDADRARRRSEHLAP